MKRLLLALLSLPIIAHAEPAELTSGIDLDNFKPQVRPQDDFYRYVNGHWLDTQKIPADKSNISSFSDLVDRTEEQLLAIIQDAATESTVQGEAQQVGELYASFMDKARADSLGLEPLAADLRLIDRLSDHSQLPQLLGQLEQLGVETFFSGGVFADAKDPDRYTLYLSQHGLALPDRDYYLQDDAKFKQARRAYLKYAETVLQSAGTIDAATHAANILELESRIAAIHWDRVSSRDAEKTYNRRALKTINEATPGFNASQWLSSLGVTGIDAVVVRQPSFYEGIGEILATTPVDTLREYLRLRLIDAYAPFLDQHLVQAHFDFHSGALMGVNEIKPRWKRGVALVEGSLGEALGKIYVARHFPPAAKTRMEQLVANLIEAYRQSISKLDWMGEETRKQALDKLSKFRTKIGYPDSWRDYSGLVIRRDDLFGNVRRSRQFELAFALQKLGKPINEDEWLMPPQMVNAYYNPIANEIVFPAAILQPPFFNMAADDAVNYGAIGAVIGHEIGHGFDDQGSRYDGDGVLRNWWTDDDRARFEQRTQKLIAQYDAYEPLPGYHVNGALTIGENIGDLGGLSIAAKAYRLATENQADRILDGYTGMQRVLIGWAQVWRRLYREQALIQRLKTDPHSPGEYRCNGTLANVPEFYEAFDVKAGDKMYRAPDQRVQIW